VHKHAFTFNNTVPAPNVTVYAIIPQIVGRPLPLRCVVKTGKGIKGTLQMKWMRENEMLAAIKGNLADTSSQYTHQYHVLKLTQKDDGKKYQCNVINTDPQRTGNGRIRLSLRA